MIFQSLYDFINNLVHSITFHLFSILYEVPYLKGYILTLLILPFIFVILIYISALIFYLHQCFPLSTFWRCVTNAVCHDHDYLKVGRLLVAAFYDMIGWFWFGYHVEGMDNIPNKGSALVVYYHAAMPFDYYFLCSKVLLEKERTLHSVVDKFLLQVPFLSYFYKSFQCTPGSVESCTKQLRSGCLLGISPGGLYEAQFGDNHYQLLWRNRSGFAKIAVKANCPVIPVFTRNVRESFRTFSFARHLFASIYERLRLPIVPLYGGFPVKLTTVVGDPITSHIKFAIISDERYLSSQNSNERYNMNLSPKIDDDQIEDGSFGKEVDELRQTCHDRLEQLIYKNQIVPGNILRALFERIEYSVLWIFRR